MLLVDRNVQWAIARQALLHWLGYGLAAAMVLALQFMLAAMLTSWREQWPIFWRLAVAMLLPLILILPLYVYSSFQLSNRFVGPVKRLRRALRELARGRPFSPVKFRKGDYWQDMADELNLAVEVLKEPWSAEDPAASGYEVDSPRDGLEIVAR